MSIRPSAVDQLGKLLEKIALVPAWFSTKLQQGGQWVTDNTTTAASRATAEQYYGISSDPKEMGMLAATNALRSQLGNPANVAAAGTASVAVDYAVRKDTSIDPSKQVPAKGPETGSYDRATESLRKYTETTLAASLTVDQGAQAQEQFKAIAQLSAAAMSDGLTPAAARAKAEMSGLADRAGDAALALAKARVESAIKFDRQTALFSPEDVSIASQLRKIYPDVTEAINSTYAAQIRFNNALKDASDTGRELTKSFASEFRNALQSGSSAWDAFQKAGSNALNKISDKLMNMAIDKLWSNAFGGSSGGLLGLLGIGGSSTGGTVGAMTNGSGSVSFGNASGTDNWHGGMTRINEQGGEIIDLPTGTRIIPHDVSSKMASGGGTFNVSVPVTIDATGADPSGLARVEVQLARLRTELPNTIVKTVKQAQAGRAL